MQLAIQMAAENIENGLGGPFGAVITKDGEVVAAAANRVTSANDPTAHAEIVAIRQACQVLGTFDLSGCILYASCEPCPMCLGAVMWARIDRLYYAADRNDAAEAGFDDRHFYDEVILPQDQRALASEQFMQSAAIEVFNLWKQKQDKIEY